MANETGRARASLELALETAALEAANRPEGRSSALRDVLLTLECLRELGTVTHREQLDREDAAERARLRAAQEPDVVKVETLRSRILRWVREEPRSISSAYEEFSPSTERETRAVLDLLVEQGWLNIGVDMKLRESSTS